MTWLVRAAVLVCVLCLLSVPVWGFCGDGNIEPSEQCDDGNTAGNDGCSSSCMLEPGWWSPLTMPVGSCAEAQATQLLCPTPEFAVWEIGSFAAGELADPSASDVAAASCSDVVCPLTPTGWARYIPLVDGQATFTTLTSPSLSCPSCWDTRLEVWVGGCPNASGTVLACDDDGAQALCPTLGIDQIAVGDCVDAGAGAMTLDSSVTFNVSAGVEYWLRLGSYDGRDFGEGCVPAPSAAYVRLEGPPCLYSSVRTYCGDGITAGAEVCDTGAPGLASGCAADCLSTLAGWDCTSDSPSVCTPACGDDLVVAASECEGTAPGCQTDRCSLEPGWVLAARSLTPGFLPPVATDTCAEAVTAPLIGPSIVGHSTLCPEHGTVRLTNYASNQPSAYDAYAGEYCSVHCPELPDSWLTYRAASDGVLSVAVRSVPNRECHEKSSLFFAADPSIEVFLVADNATGCPDDPSLAILGDINGTIVACNDDGISPSEARTTLFTLADPTCRVREGFWTPVAVLSYDSYVTFDVLVGATYAMRIGASSACDRIPDQDVFVMAFGPPCLGSSSREFVPVEVCGDGMLVGAEQCDPGAPPMLPEGSVSLASKGILTMTGCADDCLSVLPGWSCDDSQPGSVCRPPCGDLMESQSAECEDANTLGGDGCSAECTLETGWRKTNSGQFIADSCEDLFEADGVSPAVDVIDMCPGRFLQGEISDYAPQNRSQPLPPTCAGFSSDGSGEPTLRSVHTDGNDFWIRYRPAASGCARLQVHSTDCCCHGWDAAIEVYSSSCPSSPADQGPEACGSAGVCGSSQFAADPFTPRCGLPPPPIWDVLESAYCGSSPDGSCSYWPEAYPGRAFGCCNFADARIDFSVVADTVYLIRVGSAAPGALSLRDLPLFASSFEANHEIGVVSVAPTQFEVLLTGPDCAAAPGASASPRLQLVAPVCGDGLRRGIEACDDRNLLDGDGCSSQCVVETDREWNCLNSPTSSSVCSFCGDGNLVLDLGEACDDGNSNDGDGCSAACEVELGYACIGDRSLCITNCSDGVRVIGVEACDDGNDFEGDGCSPRCNVEVDFICSSWPPASDSFMSVCVPFRPSGNFEVTFRLSQTQPLSTITRDAVDELLSFAGVDTTTVRIEGSPFASGTSDWIVTLLVNTAAGSARDISRAVASALNANLTAAASTRRRQSYTNGTPVLLAALQPESASQVDVSSSSSSQSVLLGAVLGSVLGVVCLVILLVLVVVVAATVVVLQRRKYLMDMRYAPPASNHQSAIKKLADHLEDGYEIEFARLDIINPPIGAGAFGVVSRARYEGADVAVKVLTNPEGEADFIREVEVNSRLHHPNIVTFLGASLRPQAMISEFCHNGSIQALFAKPHELTKERRCLWTRQVISAMTYLHSRHPPLLHRDLKCGNVLIDASWTAKVCDLGLARSEGGAHEASKLMTRAAGTIRFAAPEVLSGTEYSIPADVYSFAITMWEMWSMLVPYTRLNFESQVEDFVVKEGGRPNMEDVMAMPEADRTVMRACWAQNPDDRPTFEELLVAYDSLDSHPITMDRLQEIRRQKQEAGAVSPMAFLRELGPDAVGPLSTNTSTRTASKNKGKGRKFSGGISSASAAGHPPGSTEHFGSPLSSNVTAGSASSARRSPGRSSTSVSHADGSDERGKSKGGILALLRAATQSNDKDF